MLRPSGLEITLTRRLIGKGEPLAPLPQGLLMTPLQVHKIRAPRGTPPLFLTSSPPQHPPAISPHLSIQHAVSPIRNTLPGSLLGWLLGLSFNVTS